MVRKGPPGGPRRVKTESLPDSFSDIHTEMAITNRPLTENFVTPAWLNAQFGKVCHECGDCFRFDIKGKVVESNLTAERIDNVECHHLNNIVPLCVTCNQRKSCW